MGSDLNWQFWEGWGLGVNSSGRTIIIRNVWNSLPSVCLRMHYVRALCVFVCLRWALTHSAWLVRLSSGLAWQRVWNCLACIQDYCVKSGPSQAVKAAGVCITHCSWRNRPVSAIMQHLLGYKIVMLLFFFPSLFDIAHQCRYLPLEISLSNSVLKSNHKNPWRPHEENMLVIQSYIPYNIMYTNSTSIYCTLYTPTLSWRKLAWGRRGGRFVSLCHLHCWILLRFVFVCFCLLFCVIVVVVVVVVAFLSR